ncbi:hypothetical protein DW923_11655 [Butyricicoccus sp. AM42-5AC]|nr:hypothetical protein DW923_11655 [Butyricicoccus sp. AM42-5AC]
MLIDVSSLSRRGKTAIILYVSLYQKIEGKAISLFSLSRGEAVPPIQRLDAGGDFTPSEGVDSGRLRRPGNAAARRRGQEGARAPYGSLAPS